MADRGLPTDQKSAAYRSAGVNLDAKPETVRSIAAHVRRTYRPEVIGDIGGFGGLFAPRFEGMRAPVLVSGADGVGTKLKIAFALDRHDTVGQDCVAMCVNDILVSGAEPLFFLDYIATGRLEPARVADIVKGVADGCEQAGCALLGGETAEMPGFYPDGEYDLAGFAVGIVDRSKLVDGSRVRPGDLIVGLRSNGLHSNGFSLVRRIVLEQKQMDLAGEVPELGGTLGAELLRPTRIYARPVLALLREFDIRGMAHITGGGLHENIPRTLPDGCSARLEASAWPRWPIFELLKEWGGLSEQELPHVFNCGIGFVLIVPREQAQAVALAAERLGEAAWIIGEVVTGNRTVEVVA